MPDKELQLEASRFTTAKALAKEAAIVMDRENCTVHIIALSGIGDDLDEIASDLRARGIEAVRSNRNVLTLYGGDKKPCQPELP